MDDVDGMDSRRGPGDLRADVDCALEVEAHPGRERSAEEEAGERRVAERLFYDGDAMVVALDGEVPDDVLRTNGHGQPELVLGAREGGGRRRVDGAFFDDHTTPGGELRGVRDDRTCTAMDGLVDRIAWHRPPHGTRQYHAVIAARTPPDSRPRR